MFIFFSLCVFIELMPDNKGCSLYEHLFGAKTKLKTAKKKSSTPCLKRYSTTFYGIFRHFPPQSERSTSVVCVRAFTNWTNIMKTKKRGKKRMKIVESAQFHVPIKCQCFVIEYKIVLPWPFLFSMSFGF